MLNMVEVNPDLGFETVAPTQALLGDFPGVTLVGPEDEERPWYKRPKVLAGIGAGLAAIGTGGYLLMRRR